MWGDSSTASTAEPRRFATMMNSSAVMPMIRHSLITERRLRFWGMVSIGSMTRFYTLWRVELRQIGPVIRDSLFPHPETACPCGPQYDPQCNPQCFPLA